MAHRYARSSKAFDAECHVRIDRVVNEEQNVAKGMRHSTPNAVCHLKCANDTLHVCARMANLPLVGRGTRCRMPLIKGRLCAIYRKAQVCPYSTWRHVCCQLWHEMSTRIQPTRPPPAATRRAQRLAPALPPAPPPQNALGVWTHYDVRNETGEVIGQAVATHAGHIFASPGHLRGQAVCYPFLVSSTPNVRRLALDMGEPLKVFLGV